MPCVRSRAVYISLEGHDRSRHDGDEESNARIKLTSALPPSFVNAGVGFFAPLPSKSGIVGIPFGAAAIVGGRIVGVKRGARAKPFRQVWIGQKLAPESNQIRLPLLEPALRSVVVET